MNTRHGILSRTVVCLIGDNGKSRTELMSRGVVDALTIFCDCGCTIMSWISTIIFSQVGPHSFLRAGFCDCPVVHLPQFSPLLPRHRFLVPTLFTVAVGYERRQIGDAIARPADDLFDDDDLLEELDMLEEAGLEEDLLSAPSIPTSRPAAPAAVERPPVAESKVRGKLFVSLHCYFSSFFWRRN